MPEQTVDYSQRSVLQNLFDPGAWQNLINGVGDIVDPAIDVWQKIDSVSKDDEVISKQTTTTSKPPTVPQNVTASYFMLGGALLVVLIILFSGKSS